MADQYDRVLIRLSSAEDDKLEPILFKLLPLVFDELLTQTDTALRAKLVNILNHVLTRAKGNAAIKLPAQSILERWFSPALVTSPNGPFFRNLSMIFLDMSIPRLQAQEQIELALYALENFEKLTGLDRVVAFLACIPGLGQIASEGFRKEQVPRCLGLLKSRPPTPSSVAFFQTAAEFLLIPCNAVEAPAVGGLPSASWSHWKSRLKSKAASDMVALKCSVLRWLASMGADPPASLVYLPSLVASVENYDAVCSMAESNCKRLDLELDLDNDMELVARLTCVGLTSPPPGKEDAAGPLKVEPKVSVPAKLRQKVLTLLQRSRGIGKDIVAYVVHLIRQSLRESEQVQQCALQLALVLAEHVDPEKLVETSSALLSEIETVFWPGGGVIAMGTATPLAFKTFGSFARQLAERPSGEGRALALKSAPQMLSLLATNENAAQDILEALSGLVSCLRGSGEDERQEFLPLLDKLVTAPRAVVRREVLRWSSALFPASAPEGRYYPLRLLGDEDPDLAKAAESALSAGGREAPPFADMCTFLALRALGSEASPAQRLQPQAQALSATPMSPLPPLAAGFSWTDLARALSFLIKLADAEGLRFDMQDASASSPPAAKKPRLAAESGKEAAVFVVLLDYVLSKVIEGKSSTVTDELVDGITCLELGLQGLLLGAFLAKGQQDMLDSVVQRAEAVLLGSGGEGGCLFRHGGDRANHMRRLGARVLGALAEQSPGTALRWLQGLEQPLADSGNPGRCAGAVLGVCELMRAGVESPEPSRICGRVLGLLLVPAAEQDSAVLACACDGLRRLSERKALVVETLRTGVGASQQDLLNRVHELSAATAETLELSQSSRDLVYASWRLLGQLAAWGGEGSEQCLDKLLDLGLKNSSEEAMAAMGLAICAAASDPLAPSGPTAASRAADLLQRLLVLAGEDEKAAADEQPSGVEDGAESLAKKRELAAKKDTQQRCAVVWLSVLIRRLAQHRLILPSVSELTAPLCRALARAVGGLSMFVADCALKSLCNLYRLLQSELRPEMLKGVFSSISNRTVVANMFVGTPDTQARKEEKDKKDSGGPNSWKIAAKERIDQVKDLMFLSRELQHPALFIGLLDQPSGSVWTGDIMREAVDLQASCLPDELQSEVCPQTLRPKLYVYLFHPNAPLRQTVVSVMANYFGCESPQAVSSKHPEEWQALAKHVVLSLGSERVASREAAVQAAQTLFRGRLWSEVSFIFEDLWTIVVKLMDDMEQQIQAVVKPLVRMMRNLTLRLCDVKVTPRKDVEIAMTEIVPLLLRFCERYKHAQPVCFEVMRELIKGAHGTSLLEPHVQHLVPPLLVSLSMLENDALQYYQFHISAKSEEKGKELEAARISNSRDSESMKLLRQLVPFITDDVAETLGPRTRDLLSRGVGANTRVGVCDFWVAVCAERPSSVPSGGPFANGMLRALAGALLDPSREVRGAAASAFASFARRNAPPELTKVVFERLLRQEQEFRTEDAQRNAYRISLARALWEVCRRCDDAMLESELKAAVASKAFMLRWSSDNEVKTGWESLWGELCPTTMGGVQRYRSEICAELAGAFAESVSRADKVDSAKAVSALAAQLAKVEPKPDFLKEESVLSLHAQLKDAVQTLPTFEGSGILVRALADLAGVLYRRKRGEAFTGADEKKTGISLVFGFCSKGSLTDRAAAAQAYLEATSATRLWPSLADAAKLYQEAAKHVDQLQEEDDKEEREPGQVPLKRHRGKGSSPAEEFLTATMDFWATALQQCRREVEDEGDLEPPEGELSSFAGATLHEFHLGSLTLRLSVVRLWKHVFSHFSKEKLPLSELNDETFGRIVWAIQDASLDKRSERLRRPALELAASLAKDGAGGKEALMRGLAFETAAAAKDSAGGAAARAVPMSLWLQRIDPLTAEQCANEVATLRSLA